MSGTPYSIRYAGDPTGTQLTQCSTRGCQAARPGERNTARGDSIVYTDFTLARIFRVGDDRIEFRADIFNAFNQWNVTADGYVGVITAANFGQHTGGSVGMARAAVPVRHDVSVLSHTDDDAT